MGLACETNFSIEFQDLTQISVHAIDDRVSECNRHQGAANNRIITVQMLIVQLHM